MTKETTYERVKSWNTKCGKNAPAVNSTVYWEALSNQAKRVEEELEELKEAIENKDLLESFDALLDLDVVVCGGLFLSGHNYGEGIDAVLRNNDWKYAVNKRAAEIAILDYNEDFNLVELVTTRLPLPSGLFSISYYSIHRLADDKIMKFPDHPKVDLTPFLAQEEA